MVFKMDEKVNPALKFFYLAHGEMSLRCLENLISSGIKPGLVVLHRDYEYEKLKESFFGKIKQLCNDSGIRTISVDKITGIKEQLKIFDAGICMGFMEIITEDIFAIPRYGILNLHCGKLPEYRGRAPISRTIMDGNNLLFITVHKIDKGVDSGDILHEVKIEITRNDDVNTLYEKCSEISHTAIIESLNKIQSCDVTSLFRKQDPDERQKAHKKISNEERRINWENTNVSIFNLIRAITTPYPCAYFLHAGSVYNAIQSELPEDTLKPDADYKVGEIISADIGVLNVFCGNGRIALTEVRNPDNQIVEINKIFKAGDVLQ
jgi:methionyl-tRNA formyltransferase